MSPEEIIPLTKEKIPTIVGYDVPSSRYTIGEEARQTCLQGKGRPLSSTSNLHSAAEIKNFLKITMRYWFYYSEATPYPKSEQFSVRRRLCDIFGLSLQISKCRRKSSGRARSFVTTLGGEF